MSYVETSVIVAALDPSNPLREAATRFLESEGVKLVSDPVLLDLAYTVSGDDELLSGIAERLGLSRGDAAASMIIYVVKRLGLIYRSARGSVRLPLLGDTPRPIAEALVLAAQRLGYRRLLHVAYARALREEGNPIYRFVTLDQGFEDARELLRDTGIELVVLSGSSASPPG